MRAVAALLVIPDSEKNPQLNEFVLHIRSSPDLQVNTDYNHHEIKWFFVIFFFVSQFQNLFDSIQKDGSGHHVQGGSGDSNMDLS